jgi:hypothetical protein
MFPPNSTSCEVIGIPRRIDCRLSKAVAGTGSPPVMCITCTCKVRFSEVWAGSSRAACERSQTIAAAAADKRTSFSGCSEVARTQSH